MIEVEERLREVVCLGVVRADGVAVRKDAPDVWAEIERLAAELHTRYAGKTPGEIPEVQPARELYRRTGEDPTNSGRLQRRCCAACSGARSCTGSTRWWIRAISARWSSCCRSGCMMRSAFRGRSRSGSAPRARATTLWGKGFTR